MIIEAGCAKHAVRMAIDEAGEDDAADLDDTIRFRRVLSTADPGEMIAVDQDGSVAENLDLRHFAPAPGASGPATCHDLPGADQQRLQSRSSFMGSRM